MFKHVQTINGTLTATGSATAFTTTEFDYVGVFINITAHSGSSPTIVVSLETSFDGGTTWFTLASGSSLNSNTSQQIVVSTPTYVMGPLCKVSYTLGGGTPSFTLTVDVAARGN